MRSIATINNAIRRSEVKESYLQERIAACTSWSSPVDVISSFEEKLAPVQQHLTALRQELTAVEVAEALDEVVG